LSTGTRGAVAHDTSVVMIKQTHSKRIAGNADARVRPALLALAPAPIGPKPREQRRYLGGDRCGFPCISAHLAREDRLQIIMLDAGSRRAQGRRHFQIEHRRPSRAAAFVNYFDTDLRLWEQWSRTQAPSPASIDRRHA
jgi:hypothetical protein